ncbi:MAG: hypothetical protein LQ342_000015 [Letrouitia transgressa]|nr:MAG: hypothetical protein LQ342_000015 [Letrouitia transgressa]
MTKPTQPEAIIPRDDFYNKIGKDYENAFSHDPGLRKIVERFLGLCPVTARILDCGCGTGKPVSYMVAETGRPLHGIDFSQTMIQLSRQQVPQGNFEHCSMLDYSPPSPEYFGGIIAMLSLFELPRSQLELMAGNFFKWIQPGGYLLIGTFGAEDCGTQPELYHSDGQCASGIVFTFMAQKVSITVFTKSGWNKLLEGAGFEIIHTEMDRFSPSAEAVCDEEPHYYVIARKPL